MPNVDKGPVFIFDWQVCLREALTPELKHWLEAKTQINQDHLCMTSSAHISITTDVRWLVRHRIDLTALKSICQHFWLHCVFSTQTIDTTSAWLQLLDCWLLALITKTCEYNSCAIKNKKVLFRQNTYFDIVEKFSLYNTNRLRW